MDWDKLRIFHSVADAGSFTAAATRSGGSQPALSRQISALEAELDVRLFHRHARGLSLTAEGEQLFALASEMNTAIERTTEAMTESRERPSGDLMVTTTVSFGSLWLAPKLEAFLRQYPEINLNLVLSDEDVPLQPNRAAVAILFHRPQSADLIQRPLLKVRHHIYASESYLEAHGTPRTATDLNDHILISYGPSIPAPIKDVNWILEIGATGKRRIPRITVNNIQGIAAAVSAGVGIAVVPDYLMEGQPGVRRILSDVRDPSFQTYFVYVEDMRGSARIKALRDYLLQEMAGLGGFL
ncbi:MAG: LysR family transcriptional regulator [Pseudomonadota bacterium]